jgi:HEAT repeat protein
MKETTLATYLQDDDAEIRRAAALACAMKESKVLVPNLILLLRDPESSVVLAAHAALKELTGRDYGPSADASGEDRDRAIVQWQRWWNRQQREK